MSKSIFIEDLIIELVTSSNVTFSTMNTQESNALLSFYDLVIEDKPFTQNQSKYIIKLLKKYEKLLKMQGFEYAALIEDPKWKKPFRVLDLTKSVHVEKDSSGQLFIALKFPYVLKDAFDKSITPVIRDFGNSTWDNDRKLRLLKFYDYNLIQINDFVIRHEFEIDESFLFALSEVEQIWQNQNHVLPHSTVIDNKVFLVNSSKDTDEYWDKNASGNLHKDLFLAKSMGYLYKPEVTDNSIVEKITTTKQNHFWIKELGDFFDLYKKIDGKVAVVINKGEDFVPWLKRFVSAGEFAGVPKSDMRVCFRMDKGEDKGFNQWVKDNNLGGKVDDGKIFIFQNKPPKWLFSDDINVTIIATNSLYPVPSSITQTWMNTHPCVCYLGAIKAANARERKIVEL